MTLSRDVAGTTPDQLPSCPDGLVAALIDRDAVISSVEHDPPKVYVRSRAAGRELFAWYTTDGSQAAVCAYEAAVRQLVGEQERLAAPPLLAVGEAWRLGPVIEPAPITRPVVDE